MFKLKTKKKSEGYPPDKCAAARCTEESILIDATKKLSADDVPLCERHWEMRCGDDEPKKLPKRTPVLIQEVDNG